MGIKHILISAYNGKSNGGPEMYVKILKDVLRKRRMRKTDNLELAEICFKVKLYVQSTSLGSAVERFLKRAPRNKLPTSIMR